MARAEFHQRGGQDCAFQVQMKLGFGQAADKVFYFGHLLSLAGGAVGHV